MDPKILTLFCRGQSAEKSHMVPPSPPPAPRRRLWRSTMTFSLNIKHADYIWIGPLGTD